MSRVVILGGGNLGDVAERLDAAESRIAECIGEITSRSATYRSEPWGFHAEQEFLNRAWVVETSLDGEATLDRLLAIERELGRDREREGLEKRASGERYASRALDLDILLFGEQRIATERLQVPHPRMREREFALVPTCEALGIDREELLRMIETIEKE